MVGEDEFVGVLKKGLEELPNELKLATPEVISKTTNIVSNGIDYCRKHKLLKSIMSYLITEKKASPEAATKLVNGVKGKFPEIAGESKNLVSAMTKAEKADKNLISCVQASIKESANNALKTANAASYLGLLVEAGKLWMTWAAIRDAKIFAKTEFVERKAMIQEKLDKLPAEITKFAEGLEKVNFEELNDKQRLRFHVNKSKQRDSLRKKMNNIEKDIGNLEARVDGKLERLSAVRDSAIASAIGQAVQGGNQAINLGMYGRAASGGHIAGAVIAMLLHFGACLGTLIFRHETGKTIEELGRKLLELQRLRDYLNEQQEELDSIFQEFSYQILED